MLYRKRIDECKRKELAEYAL